jgi:hypothetical protein
MSGRKIVGLIGLILWIVAEAAQAEVICINENPAVSETTPSADFTDNGNGTVTHKTTGLVWMRCSLGQTWDGTTCTGVPVNYTWQEALQAAQDINSGASNADGDNAAGYAGVADWRLPNKNVLTSIVETRCWNSSINAAIFPATPSSDFWSSSPVAYSTGGGAWYVSFTFGHVASHIEGYGHRVRLVRAGQ